MKKALTLCMVLGAMAFVMCACDTGTSNGGANENGNGGDIDPVTVLDGVIRITASPVPAEIGGLLAATYSIVSHDVTFQWRRDGVNVGTPSKNNPNTHVPQEPGLYTVVVSYGDLPPKTYQPPILVVSQNMNVYPISHLIQGFEKFHDNMSNLGSYVIGEGTAPDGREAYYFGNKIAGEQLWWEVRFALSEDVDATEFGYFVFDLAGSTFQILNSIQSSWPRFWGTSATGGTTSIVFRHSWAPAGGATGFDPNEWHQVVVPLARTNLNDANGPDGTNYNSVKQSITHFRIAFEHKGAGFWDTEPIPENRSRMFLRNFRFVKEL